MGIGQNLLLLQSEMYNVCYIKHNIIFNRTIIQDGQCYKYRNNILS